MPQCISTRSVALNLFRAVAHFEDPQIFVAQFLAVVHFEYVCDVVMTKLLGLASQLMAAEVISKKEVIASLLLRMVSPRAGSKLIYKGK